MSEEIEHVPGMADCRHCDGSGWFYGDAELGQCPCVQDKPMYGYYLHAESSSGGIYQTLAEKVEYCADGLVEEVSFEEYRKARDEGWEVEWTENEEL